MSEFSRRTLLGGAVAAATAATTLWNEPVHAQYVWQKSDWQAAEFDALVHSPKRIKQVVHGFGINDARFLKNAKNSLNGLRFGGGIAADQVQIVQGDALRYDLSPADVVTLYLLTSSNERLKPALLKYLKPSARVVSHDFEIRGWKPATVRKLEVGGQTHSIYLYRIADVTRR